jgi:hypothetical protein
MAVLDVTKKAAIYHTLYQINWAFAAIIEHYRELREGGLLSARFTRLYQGFTRELQSEFNQDFLLTLHKIEIEDWGRFGKVRQRWEKHLSDPHDLPPPTQARKTDGRKAAGRTERKRKMERSKRKMKPAAAKDKIRSARN